MASEENIPQGGPTSAPLPPSTSLPPTASSQATVCQVCNENMTEGQDFLIISECSHPFHRLCIETYLSTSAECPVCKRACQLNELRSWVFPSKPTVSSRTSHNRGKGRGATGRHYNTRGATRNLFQEQQNLLNTSSAIQPDQLQTPNRNTNTSGNNNNFIISPLQSNANQTAQNIPAIDYEEINRMIESNLIRMMQNLNIPQPHPVNTMAGNCNRNPNNNPTLNENNNFHNIPGISNNFPNMPSQNQNFCHFPPNSQAANISPNTFFSFNANNMHADKITSIIHNWNLKFDGSSNGLSIDEFLYRVKTLTKETFNDDFSVICKNLNTLLTGKAREWYWRYHKQVPSVNWDEFCHAIKGQYKEMKSTFDLREEIRNRKQRAGESYDTFFDALSTIADRLPRPMSEEEFIEIIARNLRPEIRQDLLYVPIRSLSHLRKLVQMRENFLSDEYVRRTLNQRSQNPSLVPRRQISEIEQGVNMDNESEYLVEAVQKSDPPNVFRCWNCDSSGHHWHDCLEDRTIFCYGCGAKDTYKPQCPKCLSRNQTSSKNLRQMGPQKDIV